jgi:hypothetical protein
MAATHVYFLPALWKMPVTAVPWFNLADSIPVSFPSRPLSEISSSTWAEEDGSSCKISKYIADTWERLHRAEGRVIEPSKPILFSRNRLSINSTQPAWAKQLELQTRRGVDQPFLTQRLLPSSSPKVPLPPPKARAREVSGPNDSKFVETFMDLQLDKNKSCSTLTPQTPTIFPKRIADPDLPIPRPRLSEWIPADAADVVDIHAELW